MAKHGTLAQLSRQASQDFLREQDVRAAGNQQARNNIDRANLRSQQLSDSINGQLDKLSERRQKSGEFEVNSLLALERIKVQREQIAAGLSVSRSSAEENARKQNLTDYFRLLNTQASIAGKVSAANAAFDLSVRSWESQRRAGTTNALRPQPPSSIGILNEQLDFTRKALEDVVSRGGLSFGGQQIGGGGGIAPLTSTRTTNSIRTSQPSPPPPASTFPNGFAPLPVGVEPGQLNPIEGIPLPNQDIGPLPQSTNIPLITGQSPATDPVGEGSPSLFPNNFPTAADARSVSVQGSGALSPLPGVETPRGNVAVSSPPQIPISESIDQQASQYPEIGGGQSGVSVGGSGLTGFSDRPISQEQIELRLQENKKELENKSIDSVRQANAFITSNFDEEYPIIKTPSGRSLVFTKGDEGAFTMNRDYIQGLQSEVNKLIEERASPIDQDSKDAIQARINVFNNNISRLQSMAPKPLRAKTGDGLKKFPTEVSKVAASLEIIMEKIRIGETSILVTGGSKTNIGIDVASSSLKTIDGESMSPKEAFKFLRNANALELVSSVLDLNPNFSKAQKRDAKAAFGELSAAEQKKARDRIIARGGSLADTPANTAPAAATLRPVDGDPTKVEVTLPKKPSLEDTASQTY